MQCCVRTSLPIVHSTGTLNIIRHNLYSDVIMGAMASQITSLTIVYSTVYSGADHRKHQSSASLAFVRGIHRWPVYSPHKWPVTRKMFPFDDVIIFNLLWPTIWIVCLHDVLLICNLDSHNISIRKWLLKITNLCLWSNANISGTLASVANFEAILNAQFWEIMKILKLRFVFSTLFMT